MITIVIPTYNCAKYLYQALDSLHPDNQTIDIAYKIIVVDDGSEERQTEANRSMAYLFDAQYVRSSPHKNANRARNLGLKLAKTEYVVLADSDCVYHEHFLSSLYEAMQKNPGAPYVYSDLLFVDGERTRHHKSGRYGTDALKYKNFIDTSSMIRNNGNIPQFDENLERLQDWDFWLSFDKLIDEYPVYLPEVLYENIIRKKSVTKSKSFDEAREYIINKHKLYVSQ